MKHILISIKPQYVEKILNKEKLLEIRKSFPKCILDGEECIVEMYCTKHNNYKDSLYLADDEKYDVDYYVPSDESFILNGKVVAKWALNKVENIDVPYPAYFPLVEQPLKNIAEHSCLTLYDLHKYLGEKRGYAWHIEDLYTYDEPKELAEFGLKRPPQSWCYIEGE